MRRLLDGNALIAATAGTAQAVVVTRNTGGFQRIPGLITVPDQSSTLALLALDAGGVLALRRRRLAA
jgi:hypothetical protein